MASRRKSTHLRTIIVALLLGAGAGYFFLLRPATDHPRDTGAEIQSAWKQVVRHSDDPKSWEQLGEVQEEDNQLAAAEHSYRMAIRLGNMRGVAYARLGFLLYAQGKDAEAFPLLAEAKNRNAKLPMLNETLTTLSESLSSVPSESAIAAAPKQEEIQPAPTPTRPSQVPSTQDRQVGQDHPENNSESAVARQTPSAPKDIAPRPSTPANHIGVGTIRTTEPAPQHPCHAPVHRLSGGGTYAARIDFGDVKTELIIDTGASITVITSEVADELGLDSASEPAIQAITANGRTTFPTAIVPEVWVGDRLVKDVRVAICENCVQDIADGLLGLDLQGALGMILDLGNEQITFRDCTNKESH